MLDGAYRELNAIDFDTTKRFSEKFERYCTNISDKYTEDDFVINLNIFLHAKATVEFFYKNHLNLAGYEFNVDQNLESIINKIINF